jgi:hypothetical protein
MGSNPTEGLDPRPGVLQTPYKIEKLINCPRPNKGLYLLTYGAEPFLRSRQLCSLSRISQHFMETKVSLTCSDSPQLVPIVSQIDPVHTIPSYLSKNLFSYCPPTSVLVFLVVSFLPHHILYAFLFAHIRSTSFHISSSFTWL